MLVDTAQTDGTTEMYLKGEGIWVNSYLVSLMFALTKPESRVLDLGGFVGEFALAAAAHGCDVVTVEANAEQAQMLATSAELNGFDRLRVVHAAVGDRAGTVSFESRGPYGQVVRGDDAGAEASYDSVTQLTVDDLVAALGWDTVDFVKIDIEGSESDAILGASRLLSEPEAPALLIECNTFVLRGCTPHPGALLRQVEDLGYTLYRVTPHGVWPWEATQFQPEVVCDYLAFKKALPDDASIELRSPLGIDEAAELISIEASRGSFDHNIALAWALQFAPPQLLAHPEVAAVVAQLQADPAEEVREEAALIGRTSARRHDEPAPSMPLREPCDGPWAAERALRQCAEARLAIAAELRRLEGPAEPTPSAALLPGPRAIALARRISDLADRHPRTAGIARRVIRRDS
jgi:FkbM family methyltransferase